MATLFEAVGGVIGTMQPSTTWAAPNGLFPTTNRNDSSAYSWASSTSTVTLPSSSLADGYLFLWGYEFEDTSNGRHNPQGRMVQASGTGTFASSATGGYNRDNSEDRSYVSGWSFVDGPSASATFQFQWRRDTDAPNSSDGTVRSFLQVVPLYYADVGVYTSTSTTATGGTTPVQITGLTGTDGTNITISSNTVSVTGDNKRYLCLGGGYHQSVGNARTQRWYGFRVDGTKDDAAKGCQYLRNTANADGGESFIRLLETVTATRTVDLFQYRGDGVGAGQGGADVNGNTTGANSQHALVVIELNDSAEVYSSVDSTGGQEFALTGPVDVDIASTADIEFNDSASFTRSTDTGVNIETDMDVFAFANVSHAREASSIGSGSRWTVHGEFTIDGTEQTAVGFHGNYNRGNQGSQDCMGSSCNQAGFFAVTTGEDIGVSNQELSGTEGGGGDIETQAGWVGFGLINLDTLEAGGTDATANPVGAEAAGEAGTVTVTGDSNVTLTGAEAAAEAGTATSEVENPRPTVGPFQFASHGLSVNSYGSFAGKGAGAVDADAFPAGAEAAGEAGTVTATGDANVSITGAETAGEAGTITVIGDASVTLTGAEIVGEAGTVTVTGDASVTLTGAESQAQAGAVTVTGDANVTVVGAESLAEAGTVTVDVTVVASPTGAEILGEAGTVAATGDANCTISGAESAAEAGTVLVDIGVSASPVGAEITAEAGAITVVGDANVTITGAETAGEAGTVNAVTPDVNAEPSGAEILGEAGTVTVIGDANAVVAGAESLAEAETVTATTDIALSVTGAEAISQAGTVTVTGDANVALTGAESLAEAGTVTVTTSGSTNAEPVGAEAAAEAGTVSVSAVNPQTIQLGPHGLTHKAYGVFQRDVTVTLLGAKANAQAGALNVIGSSQQQTQLGPHGLVTKVRNFSKGGTEVSATIVGAEIRLQAANPDLADATIYPDGEEIAAQSGAVVADAAEDEQAFPTGAEISGEAGTVVGSVPVEVPITGAAIAAEAGTVVGIGDTDVGTDVNITIVGAEIEAQAGTLTTTFDYGVFIDGAVINAQASEVGLDTNFDVSVTVYNGTIVGEAGEVDAPIVTPPSTIPDTHDLVGIRAGKKRKFRKARKEAEKIVERIVEKELDEPKPVKRVSRKRKFRIIEEATKEIIDQQIFIGDLFALERAAATLTELALANRRLRLAEQLPQLQPLVVPPLPDIADSDDDVLALTVMLLETALPEPPRQDYSDDEEELVALMTLLLSD